MTVYSYGNEVINCVLRRVVKVNRYFNCPSLEIVIESHHVAALDGDRLVRTPTWKPRT